MADVKISPLSYQSDPGGKLPTGTSSAPVTGSAAVGRRRRWRNPCYCIVEVAPNTAKWLYFVGFVIEAIVSWIFRCAQRAAASCGGGACRCWSCRSQMKGCRNGIQKWGMRSGLLPDTTSLCSVPDFVRRDYSDKIFKNIKGLDKCLGIQDVRTFCASYPFFGKLHALHDRRVHSHLAGMHAWSRACAF